MRIRAQLYIPALATAALAIAVSDASAATLFTSTAHTARVTVGATATATATAPFTLTAPAGSAFNAVPHSVLGLRVTQNNDNEITAAVYHATFFDSTPSPITPTLPWQLTITGNGTLTGDRTSYHARINNLIFDWAGFPQPMAGSLTTGVTATQPTSGSPITIRLNNAGQITGNGFVATIDGGYVFTGTAAAWSLTN